jgi:hypothetical protein
MKGAVFFARIGFFTALAGSASMAVGTFLDGGRERWPEDSHPLFFASASLLTNLGLWITASYFLPAFG